MKTVSLCVLILTVVLVACASEGDYMEQSKAEKLKMMDRMTASDRESLLTDLETEWQATKEALINNLSSQQEQTRFSAAYLLGLYRYVDAADSLAQVIDMESKDSAAQKRLARWDRYPAVEALIKIGKPSVPAMLRNLEESKNENVKELSARVISYVEGKELAKSIVANAIAKQGDPAKKANLESSLKYFEREKR